MRPFSELLNELYSLQRGGVRLGLERVTQALSERGTSVRQAPVVHIGGTNGKGSTAAMTASVLAEAGYRVGLYTSPHLESFGERFRVCGEPAAAATLHGHLDDLLNYRKQSGNWLTFFELCTVLAWELFAQEGCDFVVLEVGLGGRLDATNVAQPEVAVITSIGIDHQAYLGATLADIAKEKAGILKKGSAAVIGHLPEAADQVLTGACAKEGIVPWRAGLDFGWKAGEQEVELHVKDLWRASLALSLRGRHQAANAACAAASACALRKRGFPIADQAIAKGLARATWPGRFEIFNRACPVVIDGAHNIDAVKAFLLEARHLAARRQPRVLVVSVMRDKPLEEMMARLNAFADCLIFAELGTPRAVPPVELAQRFGGTNGGSVVQAIAQAEELADDKGAVFIVGSLYLAGAARALLSGRITREPQSPFQ